MKKLITSLLVIVLLFNFICPTCVVFAAGEAGGDPDTEEPEVKLFNAIEHELGDIVASIGASDGLLCGSPTIVAELLEPIRDILSKTYLMITDLFYA